jgi:hypothetical protein
MKQEILLPEEEQMRAASIISYQPVALADIIDTCKCINICVIHNMISIIDVCSVM